MSQNMLHGCGAVTTTFERGRERVGLSEKAPPSKRSTKSRFDTCKCKLTLLSLSPVLSSLDTPNCSQISPITLGHCTCCPRGPGGRFPHRRGGGGSVPTFVSFENHILRGGCYAARRHSNPPRYRPFPFEILVHPLADAFPRKYRNSPSLRC